MGCLNSLVIETSPRNFGYREMPADRFGRLQRLLVTEAAESSTGQEEGGFFI